MSMDLIGQIVLALIGGGGLVGVIISNRTQREQNKTNAMEAAEKVITDRGNALIAQLTGIIQNERSEASTWRQELNADRQRILQQLAECTNHRLDDANQRAELREQMAHLRGLLEGLPKVPVDAVATPKASTASG